jgi:hypothetical protein
MEPVKKSALLVIGLLGLATLGAVEPATQPSSAAPSASDTRQSTRQDRGNRRDRTSRGGGSTPVVATANDPYAILRGRSIFVKGNQTLANDSAPSQAGSGRPRPTITSPESALVFNGVIMVGDQPKALIQDTGSGNVNLVSSGDLISGGKISAITFDNLTYEAKGKVNQVELGQNLNGLTPSVAPPVVAVPTSQPSGATPPAGPPGIAVTPPEGGPAGPPPAAASAGAPPAGSSSADDILAKLRAKRQQELGK